MRRWLLLMPGLLAIAASLAVLAANFRSTSLPDRPTRAQVNAFIMSPFCPGLTLEECPSSQSAELRGEIAARLNAGASGPEIEAWLVDTYGEGVLGSPRGAAAFILPALLLGLGGILLSWNLLRWRKDEVGSPAQQAPDPADALRVESELSAFASGAE